jgi:hypothetical protein
MATILLMVLVFVNYSVRVQLLVASFDIPFISKYVTLDFFDTYFDHLSYLKI